MAPEHHGPPGDLASAATGRPVRPVELLGWGCVVALPPLVYAVARYGDVSVEAAIFVGILTAAVLLFMAFRNRAIRLDTDHHRHDPTAGTGGTAAHVTPWGLAKLAVGCLYLVAAVCWTLPPGTPGCAAVVRLAAAPFIALGLWQSWDMFAPDPMSEDISVSLLAVLDDGTVAEADLTNMPSLDLLTRYTHERWRRFCNDHLRLDANRRLWPGAARWFALRIERERGRRVMRMAMWRHWQPVVPPGEGERPEWSSVPFHVWEREP